MEKSKKLIACIAFVIVFAAITMSCIISKPNNDVKSEETVIELAESRGTPMVETIESTIVTTTEKPTTTKAPTTTEKPTTTKAPETTKAPTTTQKPTTTSAPQPVSISGGEAADYIWSYMKSNTSWNDATCAGVMGNIMREVGGDTLNGIKPTLYSSSGYYYGICQWNRGSFGFIHGASLDAQLDYLCNKWVDAGDFSDIENSASGARTAALRFAKQYERCSSAGYTQRQNNAANAYNHYVN